MKALKVLAITMLAAFSFTAANAQHHRMMRHHHHHVMHHRVHHHM